MRAFTGTDGRRYSVAVEAPQVPGHLPLVTITVDGLRTVKGFLDGRYVVDCDLDLEPADWMQLDRLAVAAEIELP